MWRLPGGFVLLFGFPVPPMHCYLSPSPGALLCGKILASDFVGNSGSLDACRPFAGHTLENNPVHIGLCDSCPCVDRRNHSCHVVGRYIFHRALVSRGRLSGITLLPGPDHCVVLCAEPALPAG